MYYRYLLGSEYSIGVLEGATLLYLYIIENIIDYSTDEVNIGLRVISKGGEFRWVENQKWDLIRNGRFFILRLRTIAAAEL